MTKVRKECIKCNKVFFVRPYRKDIAKFCSHYCYSQSLVGKKQSIKSNKKRSDTNKRIGNKPPHPGFGKNNIFYGQKHSQETKLTWNKIRTGPKIKKECKLCKKIFQVVPSETNKKFCSRKCSDIYYKGENAHNWKGGVTKLRDLLRQTLEYKKWRKLVFVRDDYLCQRCHQENSGNLHVHHIKMISKIFEDYDIKSVEKALNCKELWDTNNGITLCNKCHGKIRYHEQEYVPLFLKILAKKELQTQSQLLVLAPV